MRKSIIKRLGALMIAISIGLNMSPFVFAESESDTLEESQELIDLETEDIDEKDLNPIQEIEVDETNSIEVKEEEDKIDVNLKTEEIETTLDSLTLDGDNVVNTKHTIKAQGRSQNGVLYKFYVKEIGVVGPAWTVIQDYSDKTSASWTPKKDGEYLYGVHIKDRNSKEARDTHLYLPVTIEQGKTEEIETTLDSLTLDGDNVVNTKHTIEAQGRSQNGVLYKFYVKEIGVVGPAWTVIQDYSDKTSASWTPKKDGEYLYGVHIKDRNSKEARDTHLYLPVTIEQGKTEEIETTLDSLTLDGDNVVNTKHTIEAQGRSQNGVLYKFYVKEIGVVGPAWTVIQDYSDKTSASWTPKKDGEYLYGVHIKDRNSKEARDTHLYLPVTIEQGKTEEIETTLDSLTLDGDNVVNTKHTIKAQGRSQNGVLYKFYVKEIGVVGPAWTVIQDYSDKTSASWTPKKDGEYLYGVHIKDRNSKEARDTHLYLPVTIEQGKTEEIETTLDSLTLDGDNVVNTKHTIEAQGRSQNGVLYKFYVKEIGVVGPAWTVIQDYSDKTSASWTPKKDGEYLYGVHIKDRNSKEARDTHLYLPVTIEQGKTEEIETTLDSLTLDGDNVVNTKHTIKAQGRSQNGVLYKFYVKEIGVVGPAWTVIQDYSDKTSASWTPKKDGEYLYGVHIKDKNSKEARDTHLYLPVTISELEPAKLESLTITGMGYENKNHILQAEGISTNKVLYQFYVKDLSTNKWTIIQKYSTKNTADWKPDKAGNYWYGVHIKDEASSKPRDDHQYIPFTVNPPMSYRITEYGDTFEQALNKQVGRNKIWRSGNWVNASKDEIRQYLDPNKFLQFLPGEPSRNNNLISLKINRNTILRKEASTSGEYITNLSVGQVYVVLAEKNEWYQINSTGKIGWVHGDNVELVNDVPREMYQFMVLSGQAGSTINQMNKELVGQGILQGRGAAFIEASKKYNINELYLMAHSFLETGRGTSQLSTGVLVSVVDGKPVAPRTVYNMYGIGAFDNSALRSGSERAYKEGWFTPETAIIEGANWISKNYINNSRYNQDTLYKMKYNPSTPGTHQYATDIAWAVKQNRQIDQMMEICKNIEGVILRFDIPKYQ